MYTVQRRGGYGRKSYERLKKTPFTLSEQLGYHQKSCIKKIRWNEAQCIISLCVFLILFLLFLQNQNLFTKRKQHDPKIEEHSNKSQQDHSKNRLQNEKSFTKRLSQPAVMRNMILMILQSPGWDSGMGE